MTENVMVRSDDAAPRRGNSRGGAMAEADRPPARRAKRRAMPRAWLGAMLAAAFIAIAAGVSAQQAPGEDAAVLTADTALGDAMRASDKSSARRLLSLQFTFADEDGKIHERKEFLDGLKSFAPAAATDIKARVYGLVAMVTGNRKSALGSDVFFLDIWAKQKGAWRALTMQDVVLAAANEPSAASAPGADGKTSECKNPCETIPYRIRSPAEQDIVNAFQAIEKATVTHDAGEWGKHVAEEFVLYRSGRAPIPKSDDIATIDRQKQNNAAVTVSEIETMRLSVYGDGAAMIATYVNPDNSRPPYRAASVWVKRSGQWQLAIGVETDIK
jgi:Domain of unknown function (DUF4440)